MFDDLRQAMIAAGIDPAHAPLVADGRLRRFHLPSDRRGADNAWIVLHDNGDGSFGAAFGNWKTGQRSTWHSRGADRLSAAERADFARRMSEARRRAAEEQRRRHAEAAEKAARLWHRARSADPAHAYLVRKGVKIHGIRQMGGTLVIPLTTGDGALVGLQFIGPDGSKRFLSGTAKRGAWFTVGQIHGDVLLIAEGYATAATLHEASGYPVACAFDAGNLRPVAEALRALHSAARVFICADADPTGRTAAHEAAEAVGGTVIEPTFPEEPPHG